MFSKPQPQHVQGLSQGSSLFTFFRSSEGLFVAASQTKDQLKKYRICNRLGIFYLQESSILAGEMVARETSFL